MAFLSKVRLLQHIAFLYKTRSHSLCNAGHIPKNALDTYQLSPSLFLSGCSLQHVGLKIEVDPASHKILKAIGDVRRLVIKWF